MEDKTGTGWRRGSGMIWKTLISMKAAGADQMTESPSRVLDLGVIGGEAFLDVHDVDDNSVVAREQIPT
jgi:hypothetical protein